jgi:hypothetical protein
MPPDKTPFVVQINNNKTNATKHCGRRKKAAQEIITSEVGFEVFTVVRRKALAREFFYPEDGGGTFLRNIGS